MYSWYVQMQCSIMHRILFTSGRCALFFVYALCNCLSWFCLILKIWLFQARSIQDLAKRDFENLRHEGEDGEPQPKVVRRGRPPSSKNMKKCIETSPVDRVGPEISSGATLASGEDKAIGGSNSYNLRKAQPLFRFRSNDVSLYRSRNGESYSERSTDWNEEFPGFNMYIMCIISIYIFYCEKWASILYFFSFHFESWHEIWKQTLCTWGQQAWYLQAIPFIFWKWPIVLWQQKWKPEVVNGCMYLSLSVSQ